MRPEDTEVLARYLLGRATRDEANEAFEASLRDPRWMTRCSADHHASPGDVAAWLRGSAQELKDAATKPLEAVKLVCGYYESTRMRT